MVHECDELLAATLFILRCLRKDQARVETFFLANGGNGASFVTVSRVHQGIVWEGKELLWRKALRL